jgi:hypothetical protein
MILDMAEENENEEEAVEVDIFDLGNSLKEKLGPRKDENSWELWGLGSNCAADFRGGAMCIIIGKL